MRKLRGEGFLTYCGAFIYLSWGWVWFIFNGNIYKDEKNNNK